MRPSPWESLLHLASSIAVRGLREGLIVRALAWPALFTGVAMIGAVAVAALFYNSDTIAVAESSLVTPLRQQGLRVSQVQDPEAALNAGLVDRAAWWDGERWVLASRFASAVTLRAEAVLRAHADAAWVPEVPRRTARDPSASPAVRLMVGQLAVLFVLYAAVFGAGGLMRDREDGTLEAELALPLAPRWHAAARILAASVILGVSFAVSLLLLHGLLMVNEPWEWLQVSSAGVVSGVSVGIALMSRAGRSEALSGPLSRAMVMGMFAVGLGWSLPAVGRHLPVSAIGALVRGGTPSLLGPLLALGLALVACALFERRQG